MKINYISTDTAHGFNTGYVGKLHASLTSYNLYSDPLVEEGSVLCENFDGSFSRRKLSEFTKEGPLKQVHNLHSSLVDNGILNTDEALESQIEWMRNQYDREHHDQLDTPRPKTCDCGGEKAGTTHSSWCSTQGGEP